MRWQGGRALRPVMPDPPPGVDSPYIGGGL